MLPEVRDYGVAPSLKVTDLIRYWSEAGGFTSRKLAQAAEIAVEMASDPDCFIFMSFTGNLVATGLRGVISQLIKRGLVDAIITTGGAIDHDIARARHKYYCGSFEADDSQLKEAGIHRLGNVFIPQESYGIPVEKFVRSLAARLGGEMSASKLLMEAGSMIEDENSILRAASEAGIPVFSPGILDSAFGTALAVTGGIKLDLLSDMKFLFSIAFELEKSGGLVVGGGISKHHLIWWNQFKGGLDYAIYMTTAVEWDGSLSGAYPREAVTWGKIKPRAKAITVEGDATVTLPLLACYLLEKVPERVNAWSSEKWKELARRHLLDKPD
ncbi:MAG: deoxyhypusine synthase [Thermoproteota archaeon]|nr:MAG: deoxyhypusine synthase [Candidatus Korarchaeota archaeon]